jgi:hypothetical protein
LHTSQHLIGLAAGASPGHLHFDTNAVLLWAGYLAVLFELFSLLPLAQFKPRHREHALFCLAGDWQTESSRTHTHTMLANPKAGSTHSSCASCAQELLAAAAVSMHCTRCMRQQRCRVPGCRVACRHNNHHNPASRLYSRLRGWACVLDKKYACGDLSITCSAVCSKVCSRKAATATCTICDQGAPSI